MSIYYIDFKDGKNENDGLTENAPINSYRDIDLKDGDKVLFKRGSFIRDELYTKNGVTYGAYGEGENPVFCGSFDAKDKSLWKEVGKNIWRYMGKVKAEVCNFVFDDGNVCGRLRWEKEDLCQQGDFWDNCFGTAKILPEEVEHIVLMYSKKNPCEIYSQIECATREHITLANVGQDLTISDITFINAGVCCIACDGHIHSKNMHIKNCTFKNIGGNVWSKELKIRFGNAVECWNVCENVTVENCVFDNIYDTAVTHQGSLSVCQPAKNFIIRNNIFKRCGMAAYEQRELIPLYAEFSGNICESAGEGFSHIGEVMPRQSEIWPQPMGHHIFLWKIETPTENGKILIKDNKFGDAIWGKAIYSIIDKEAEKQVEIVNNDIFGKYIEE